MGETVFVEFLYQIEFTNPKKPEEKNPLQVRRKYTQVQKIPSIIIECTFPSLTHKGKLRFLKIKIPIPAERIPIKHNMIDVSTKSALPLTISLGLYKE